MIKNYYYLVAGILAILFSVTHAWNGQTVALPSLDVDPVSLETKTTFVYVWHVITVENFLFGITFIVMSLQENLSKVKFAAWVIVAIMIGRWLVIFGVTLFLDPSGVENTLIDSVAIIIYTSLIILGTRLKKETK